MSVLAKRLKEARVNSGLSQERLGVLAGIDEMSASARMNQYERDKHIPDPTMVARIAKALKLPAAFFYAENDNEANLLCRFHKLKAKDKMRVLEFITEVESGV